MAQGWERMQVIGNLGKDPEMRHTNSGMKVCVFSVAVNVKYRDSENTNWWNISAFDKTAELCSQYLKKGSKVFIDGRPVQRKYSDRDGVERISFSLTAEKVVFLDPKGSNDSRQQNSYSNDQSQHSGPESSGYNYTDNDIPY